MAIEITDVTTNFAALTKRRYVKLGPAKFMHNHVFMDICEKDTEVVGDPDMNPVIHTGPQGLSGAATNVWGSSAEQDTTKSKSFQVSVGDYFGAVTVGDKAIVLSRNNIGAFLRAKALEIDGLWGTFGDITAAYVMGNGGGSIARGSGSGSAVASNTITLANRSDMISLFEGQLLVASADDGDDTADTLRDNGDFVEIESIDHAAKTITVDDYTKIAGLLDNDYFFRRGDFVGNNNATIIKGLQAWNPVTAPGAGDSFSSVNRSTNVVYLSGYRGDGITGSIEDRIQQLAAQMYATIRGLKLTHGVLNPLDWDKLQRALQSRGYRPTDGKYGRFGYKALEVYCQNAVLEIISDPWAPPDTVRLFDRETCIIRSALGLPHTWDGDGNEMLRASNGVNGYEYRLVAYPYFTTAPYPSHVGYQSLV